jgi:hypothetical protein
MKLNKILIFSIFVYLYSCAGYENNKTQRVDKKIYHSSSGFALVYEDFLYNDAIVNKKINNNDIVVLHAILKKNTRIRITNLNNSKFIDTKIYKKANFPKIFNVVISKRIALLLELDNENPFVEIIELKKNKTFIAKDGNIFEQEKNVADKAPVDEITMNDLTIEETKKIENKSDSKKFILVISDFYYENSALELKSDLIKKTKLNNISIKKINNNKYRLLVGPFENFNALKTTYISLNNLGFESLNVYNE